jgi:hypothetical protein
LQRQAAAAQKAGAAQRLAAIFREILNVHRQDLRPPSGRLRRRRSRQLPPGSMPLNCSAALNSPAPLTMRQKRTMIIAAPGDDGAMDPVLTPPMAAQSAVLVPVPEAQHGMGNLAVALVVPMVKIMLSAAEHDARMPPSRPSG